MIYLVKCKCGNHGNRPLPPSPPLRLSSAIAVIVKVVVPNENQGEDALELENTVQAKLANREPEPELEPEEHATGSPPQPVASCSHSTGSSQWMYEVSDLALWGEVSESARAVLIDGGPAAFHNCMSRYPASTRDCGLGGKVRSFTNDLL
ncbi:hypothetical protein ABVT39_001069 [Epinephelus coioides]